METRVLKRLQIITGSHYPELAGKVAKKLGIKISLVDLQRFANGEVKCQLEDSVRGSNLFVFQTHNAPVNDSIMEQAIIIDAAKRASAKRITAVCPFLGYARQDRKSLGREPITARLVIDILSTAGADRIVSIDLHSSQIQGFFDGPFDHLVAMPVLIKHIQKKFGKNLIVVSPDAGRVKTADSYARALNAELAIVYKRRIRGGQAEAQSLIGDVVGRNCVIVDDMIDTAGTVCSAAEVLKRQGAKQVAVVATHGLFSPPAKDRLKKSDIDHLVITDSLPLPISITKPKIEIVSIVPLLAAGINAIFEERSLSKLFEAKN